MRSPADDQEAVLGARQCQGDPGDDHRLTDERQDRTAEQNRGQLGEDRAQCASGR